MYLLSFFTSLQPHICFLISGILGQSGPHLLLCLTIINPKIQMGVFFPKVTLVLCCSNFTHVKRNVLEVWSVPTSLSFQIEASHLLRWRSHYAGVPQTTISEPSSVTLEYTHYDWSSLIDSWTWRYRVQRFVRAEYRRFGQGECSR